MHLNATPLELGGDPSSNLGGGVSQFELRSITTHFVPGTRTSGEDLGGGVKFLTSKFLHFNIFMRMPEYINMN